MGRELRRKQAKKDGKSLEKDEIVEKDQIKRLIIIVAILLVIICLIYLISAVFITKELNLTNDDTTSDSSTNSVDNTILASSIFKQAEDEYYVYFYDFSDKENSNSTLIKSKLETTNKVYKVNTSSAMNVNYVSDIGNKNAKSLADLKVVDDTLIKISNNTIVEYYEKNEIVNKLS